MRWSSSEHGLTFGPFRDPKWEAKSPCGRTSQHITSHLGGKFPQVSHSSTIGGESSPKPAQILCGSPHLGDPGTDAARATRATPPYPLDTFGGLRTNFSSINPSDRASVIRAQVRVRARLRVGLRVQVRVRARGRARIGVRIRFFIDSPSRVPVKRQRNYRDARKNSR